MWIKFILFTFSVSFSLQSKLNSRFQIQFNLEKNKGDSIADIAKIQIGKPFKWKQRGPDSFDCQGLAFYVHKQNGIIIPLGPINQFNEGQKISKSNLKPGDLVFFEIKNHGGTHVGIYIGNGKYVHAPSPGQNICIDDLEGSNNWKERYKGARRYWK